MRAANSVTKRSYAVELTLAEWLQVKGEFLPNAASSTKKTKSAARREAGAAEKELTLCKQ